jgi:hypothetical protein
MIARGHRLIAFGRTPLMTFKPQPLLSQALCLFIKRVDFLVDLCRLFLARVSLANLVKRLLYREFGCVSHIHLSRKLFPLLPKVLAVSVAKFA